MSGAGGSGIAVAVDASDGRMQRLLATALQGDLDSLLAEVLALDVSACCCYCGFG